MTDGVVIYTKRGCHYCESAIALLTARGVGYHELVVGEDLSPDEFKALHPLVHYVPYIIDRGRVVGGYSDLVEHFQSKVTLLTEEE